MKFRALRCTGVDDKRLNGRYNSSLAKVGVEGSNPFARSNFPDSARMAVTRGFLAYFGVWNLARLGRISLARKARGYLLVTGSPARRAMKSWCRWSALECNG